MMPMQPDEINEILSTPAIETGVDEATEVAARRDFKRLADAMGHEKFVDFGMRFLLKMEAQLRKTMSPDSPAIRALDEYHLLHG